MEDNKKSVRGSGSHETHLKKKKKKKKKKNQIPTIKCEYPTFYLFSIFLKFTIIYVENY